VHGSRAFIPRTDPNTVRTESVRRRRARESRLRRARAVKSSKSRAVQVDEEAGLRPGGVRTSVPGRRSPSPSPLTFADDDMNFDTRGLRAVIARLFRMGGVYYRISTRLIPISWTPKTVSYELLPSA
jgi:hypothetical protein